MLLVVLNMLLIYSLHFGGICLAVIMTFKLVHICIGSSWGKGAGLQSFSTSSLRHREAADAILKYDDDDDGKCHCFLLQPSI